MDRKVVILPNDGSKVFELVLGVTPSGELERHAVGYHAVGYLEYMKEKGIRPYQKFREILESKKIVLVSEVKKGEKVYVSRFRNS